MALVCGPTQTYTTHRLVIPLPCAQLTLHGTDLNVLNKAKTPRRSERGIQTNPIYFWCLNACMCVNFKYLEKLGTGLCVYELEMDYVKSIMTSYMTGWVTGCNGEYSTGIKYNCDLSRYFTNLQAKRMSN